MPKNRAATDWNSSFDDRPTSDDPRIKFSQVFSREYLDKRNLILEIGCGIGSYTKLVDREGCFGLDLDINAVKIAKRYSKSSQFVVASALNLPFKGKTFDLIYMWSVLEEIPKGWDGQILTEIRKILRYEGVLLMSVYGNHFISKILDPAYIFRGVRHHDLEKFLNLIFDSGFIIDQYTVRGKKNTLISILLVHLYKHILKKKGGMIKNYFDKKSAAEINSSNKGIVYIYIAAKKRE